MFGNSKSARFKSAEDALQTGQLDLALTILTAPELAGHARAGELLARLCEPLLRRAQEHAVAERFLPALADLDKAARCGVLRDKIDDWRQRIVDAMNDQQRRQRQRRDAVEAARQQLADGELTVARNMLEQAADHHDAGALAQQARLQAQRAAAALADARTALANGDLAAASRAWAEARERHAGADDLPIIEREICAAAIAAANDLWRAGRLDRLATVFAALGAVGADRSERHDIDQWLHRARQAAAAVRCGDYRAADVALGQLSQIAPPADWCERLRAHVRELMTHRAAIDEGPLGLLAGSAAPLSAARGSDLDITTALPRAVAPPPVVAETPLPPRFILSIDGVGSYLVLRGDRVIIGRAGPGSLADLPLVSDLPEQAADIVRRGEDYFLTAAVDAAIAQQPVRQALLNSGDRIELGRRVRFTFVRPSRKSDSAFLDLAPGLRTSGDVRRVILAGGPILLGGASDCHVPVRGANVVISERGGRWAARVVGPGSTPSLPLALGQIVDLPGVRMSIQPLPAGSSAGWFAGS